MLIRYLVSLCLLFPAIFCLSQPAGNRACITSASLGFIENKGQVIDQDYKPNPAVLYLLNMPGMNVQLRRGGFSYDLYGLSSQSAVRSLQSIDQPDYQDSPTHQLASSSAIFFDRIDFDFINSNPHCEIIPSGPSFDYLNYYTTGTPAEGVLSVKSYKTVTCKNIYPKIDLEFLTDEENGFKYNFIVFPGGRVEDIQIHITDPGIELTPDGSLHLKNTIGTLEEDIPQSYFFVDGIKDPVKIEFVRIGENTYGVRSVSETSQTSTLIIDPTPRRIWGTYYGGSNNETAGDLAIDKSGNLYFCGNTSSATNIATSGSHQSTIKGNYDSFLVRFDNSGQRFWGTYYGGENNEHFEACVCDKQGRIYMSGRTSSQTFIATAGSHQPVYGGGLNDNYLAKFNSSGQLLWATYYGGSSVEGDSECATDDSLHVYLCGSTGSPDNIATAGAHQTINNGNGEAYLAKFDSNGIRLWGTYYGGILQDNGYGCCTCNDGTVYLTGESLSSDNIATPGSHQPLYSGSGDAFLVKFTSAGQRLWGTYYGGLNTDEAHGCILDTNNNVYFCGYTLSSENISTPGCHQFIYGGFGDGFIARFNPDGTRQWGTYYGGILQEIADKRVLSIDDSGFIYFNGATTSPDSIATVGAYQPAINGNFDAFLVKFNDQGIRIWGTYYGGTAWDNAVASVADNCGHQYLLGGTSSLASISTPGTQQPLYGGGSQDAYLVKLADCIPPDTAGQISGPLTVCANTNNAIYTVPVIQHATGYNWTLPSGFTIVSGSNTNAITVNIANNAVSGIISVFGSSCCEDGMPSSISVTVLPRPVPGIIGNDTLCEGAMAIYFTEPGKSQYQWVISPGGSIISGGTAGDTSVTATWNVTGTQWIHVNYTDTNGCNAFTSTIKYINILAGIPINVSISESQNNVCAGSMVTFTANPTNPGATPVYQWKVNSISTGTNSPTFIYAPNNGDFVQCILTSSNTVCTSNNPAASNTITMGVNPNLFVNISVSPSANPVCAGTPVTFTATPSNPGLVPVYQWRVNGVDAGTNSAVYTYIPVNGDVVSCTLFSSETCTLNNPAISNLLLMVIDSVLVVNCTIAASINPVCAGLPVTFTATPVNGGTSPSYQWKVNGINAGPNAPVYAYIPSNGDMVNCTLTSGYPCTINNPITTNTLSITTNNPPQVTFTPCFDTITTTNAKPIRLKGGIPLGGTYSCSGCTGGFMNPPAVGVGTHIITYAYTNAALCSASAGARIHVFSAAPFNCGSTLTDIRDGKTYPTIQIGSQCWMAANLNYGIPVPSTQYQRDNCLSEKYCYQDLSAECSVRGAMYQWDELMRFDDTPGLQGLCPPAWHIPSEADWNTLFSNWGSNGYAGSPLKFDGYSGFNALLVGVNHQNRQWDFADFATLFWSSSAHGPYKAWAHGMNSFDPSVSNYPSLRSNAFNVRCLKD
jgi:uncharacterized protein (TIGR02145 family)